MPRGAPQVAESSAGAGAPRAPAATAHPCAGDLDGDGDLDVVTGNSQDRTASVLLNQAAGQFVAYAGDFVANLPSDISLGDLDGDGDLDMAVAHFGSGSGSVLLNQRITP